MYLKCNSQNYSGEDVSGGDFRSDSNPQSRSSGKDSSGGDRKMAEHMDVDDDLSSELCDSNDNLSTVSITATDANRKQKENHLLRHLPYYEDLKKENEEYWDKVIENLSKAILCQDFQIGVVIYTKCIKTYIYLYGRSFTKEHHVKLVNLFIELLTMESCPFSFIPDAAELLNTLLRKPELLTRDDIVIPWRKLYQTLDRCVFHRRYTLSFQASAKIETVLKELIRFSNVYFEKNSLPEVIAEFTPMLCPTSPKMIFGLEMLKHFLPFLDPDSEADLVKFLQHLLGYSDSWNNHPTWEWTMMSLLATAAWNMPGKMDWTPYLPTMYARLMKNLELPVHFKGGKNAPQDSGLKVFQYNSAARWMVASLGNNLVAMKHLTNFLKSLETYYNPSNHGRWTMPLGALLNELVNSFTHRLKKERYMDNKKRWWYRIPEERKLTDEDIEKFVKITSSIVLDFYLDVGTCGMVLKNLASIKPEMIIPAVMEKYQGIVETVTEPRKYMTTMRWVTIIMLPMVSSRKEKEGYDGRKLVLPFAMSLLPAIDPNDMFKTLSALGCLHGLFNLLPFVDCSALAGSIEEDDERELCSSTACLEDFIVQFMDRILALVETRSVENTRMADNRHIGEGSNIEDTSLEKFLWAVFHRVATQSSSQICKTVVKKVISFALGNTLETSVSGKLFASILQAFVVARPDITLPKLLPQLCASVNYLITDEIIDDEDLDKTLLFQLLLLSYVMETSGIELLKYRTDIEMMLPNVLKLNGKKAHGFAAKIVSRCLQSLVYLYPTESRISEADYDDPNYMAINDWGISIEPKAIKTHWHSPSQEELDWAVELFLKLFTQFTTNLSKAKEFTEANDEFNKRLLKNMQLLLASYDGISTILTFWDDEPIKSHETVVDLSSDIFDFGFVKPKVTVPGSDYPITKKLYDVYCDVLNYLQAYKADDTDAFLALMRGFDSLIMPHVESERRLVPVSKQSSISLQNNLDPKKKYTRGGIIVRSYDIHIKRARCASCTTWTKSHVEVLHKLFLLCINHYARVRLNAQTRFFRVLDSFGGLVCRTVTHFFEEHLKEGVHHDEYKGALYTILGRGTSPLLHNSWEGVHKLWLALVHSPFSEKNSIIKIMEKIKNTITQNFIFFPLHVNVVVEAKVFDSARALLSKSQLLACGDLKIVESRPNANVFLDLLNGLTEAGVDGSVHWRRQVMCANMLSVLIIDLPGVPLTRRSIEIFFEGLISHSIDIRKTASTTLSWILVLFKRVYPTVIVNTKEDIQLEQGESMHSFLQYKMNPQPGDDIRIIANSPAVQSLNPNQIPAFYVHKVHYGFSGMPAIVKLKISPDFSAPPENQPESRSIVLQSTMKYFGDEEYIKQLLEVWSLEEKGKSKSSKRANICKSIARNNGPPGLKLLIKSIHALGTDKDQWKQRCAADVLCGTMYGMKLWDENTTEEFWTVIKPTLCESLDKVTQETMDFWSATLAYPSLNRDPKKMRFFIEILRERFTKSLETAQTTSVDAYKEMVFFEQAISNVQWRGGQIFDDVLNLVKMHFFDTPVPYMNVRVQLGRLLGTVFEWDVIDSPIPFGCNFSPKYATFVDFLFQNLNNLEEEASKYQSNEKDNEENSAIRNMLLKFKTVMEWILSVSWENESSISPSFFRFIPILCNFESYDPDPEIAQSAALALSGMARLLIHPKYMDDILVYLNQAAAATSWKARLCVLEFLKVFALNNLSVFASNEKWSSDVVALILKLLSDRKLEVRELSSKILCGFLHCLLIKEPMELLKTFVKASTKFKKIRQGAREGKRAPLTPEEIDHAHSDILGLCAFVDTHPYHVPAFLPDVLVTLTTHLHDPQPIPATIRKCLSNFRRTHHDNWAIHKLNFSEDQLCILTDIFVSPCYYA